MSQMPAASAPSVTETKSATESADTKKAAPSIVKKKAAADTDESDDDSPFEIDATTTKRAVPLHPKPAKGKTHRVICPMCDTPGFTAKKAAGMDVRCANPDCMVPVFTAPPLEVEEKPAEEQQPEEQSAKKRMSPTVLIGGIVSVAVIAVGVVAFIISSSQPDELPGIPVVDQQTKNNRDSSPDVTETNETPVEPTKDDPEKDDTEPKTPTVTAKLTWDDIRDFVLPLMVASSQQRSENRSKPFCRRLTADAYAEMGNFAEAEQQIGQLEKVGGSVPYYRIPPLVTMAWKNLESDDQPAAKDLSDRALAYADDLPGFGQFSVETASSLAAVLISMGREDDAKRLLDKISDTNRAGQVAAVIQSVRDLQSYDFDSAMQDVPLSDWKSPEWVATTVSLVAHDHVDKALKFALSNSNVEIVNDCVVAWCVMLVKVTPQSAVTGLGSQIDAAANNLDSEAQARLYANVAWMQFRKQDQPTARLSLGKALNAIGSVAVPAELFLPPVDPAGSKQFYHMELPDRVPLETAAFAWFEIAHVQAALEQAEAAWMSCEKGLAFLRGSAPSPRLAATHWVASSRKSGDDLRKQLQATLELDVDQARAAIERYRRKASTFRKLAKERYRIQNAMLMEAIDWGLLEQVWEEIRNRSIHHETDKLYEPYRNKQIGKLMLDRYRAAGNRSRVTLLKEFTQNSIARIPRDQTAKISGHAVVMGKIKEATSVISKYQTSRDDDDDWRDQLILRLSIRLVNLKKTKQAFKFIKGFRNPLIRERAFELAAARATILGQGQDAMAVAKPRADLSATEKVALYRGIVAGMMARSGDTLEQVSRQTAKVSPAESVE